MTSAEAARLRVSVVYLRPDLTFERTLLLPAPATVGAAIEASDIRRHVPELAGADLEAGVFSQRRTLADPLCDGDRVEIYRPLTIDPKEARRIRVTVRRRRMAGRSMPAV
jgi:putative ubiquitin-RnfH superfamily antitoxin RatB of RatAB toxin-antitoxin module